MPAIRHDDLLLRLVKEIGYIRAAVGKFSGNLPLYDIASENTPAPLTTSQNNYPPGNYDVLRLSGSVGVKITGIRGGVRGRALRLFNVGSSRLYLSHQDANSDAENRFNIVSDQQIKPGDSFQLYYDAAVSRWLPLSTLSDNLFEVNPMQTIQTITVCWSEELGVFCCVGRDGSAVYHSVLSSDGVNWTDYPFVGTGPTSAAWSADLGIFCGVNLFAVTDTYTSPDGINWTTQAAVLPTASHNIVWSPDLGLFCALALAGRVELSANGIVWNEYDSGFGAGSFNCICWSPELGLFCAISDDAVANQIGISANGQVWTLHPASAAGGTWTDVAWSPELGLFCAVSPTSPYIMTSPDGQIWTTSVITTTPSIITPRAVAWSPALSKFYVVCASTTYPFCNVLSSSNGTTWSYESVSGEALTITDVAWSPKIGIFCALASGKAIIGI